MARPYNLFVSFPSEEAEWVSGLVAYLEQALEVHEQSSRSPFRCFFDRQSIHAGENWHTIMLPHVETADRFLFVVTDRSVASPWCVLELNTRMELDGYSKILFVVCQAGFPFHQSIMRYQRYVDGTSPEKWETGRLEVVDWLCKPKTGESRQFKVRPGGPAMAQLPPLSMEDVWHRVRPKVCLVCESRSRKSVLGFAWREKGNQFRSSVFDDLPAGLKGGREGLSLHWTHEDGANHLLEIIEMKTTPSPAAPLLLWALLSGPLPGVTWIAPEGCDQTFPGGELLCVTHASGQLVPVLVFVMAWNEPGAVELPEDGTASLQPGALIFDACAYLVGSICVGADGRCAAIPV